MKTKVKPTKKTPQHVLDRLAKDKLDEFMKASGELHALATKTYEAQDMETREAIERIQDVVTAMFRKRFYVAKTRTGERAIRDLPNEIHSKLTFYIAVEIVKDLGLMDIRVANFKFTKDCAVCGKKVKK